MRQFVLEPLKGRLTVRQGRGAVSVPHGRQHGSNMRHRSIQLVRNGTVNVACGGPYRRIDGRLRHFYHFCETRLHEIRLSVPLGIVLRRIGLQSPDDAFQ